MWKVDYITEGFALRKQAGGKMGEMGKESFWNLRFLFLFPFFLSTSLFLHFFLFSPFSPAPFSFFPLFPSPRPPVEASEAIFYF